jgi:hypothetical protein
VGNDPRGQRIEAEGFLEGGVGCDRQRSYGLAGTAMPRSECELHNTSLNTIEKHGNVKTMQVQKHIGQCSV